MSVHILEQLRDLKRIHKDQAALLKDISWIFGIVCAGGNISTDSYRIRNEDEALLKKVSKVAEEAFDASVTMYDSNRRAAVRSKNLIPFLTPMREEKWPLYLRTVFPALLSDTDLLSAFLGGYYDLRGQVTDPDKDRGKYSLRISSTSESSANEIRDAVERIGVLNARVGAAHPGKYRVKVSPILQIQAFAESVTSSIQRKDELLHRYRELPTPKLDRSRADVYEKVMKLHQSEGLGTTSLLRHPELQGLGLTKMSIETWIYRGRTPYENRNYVSYAHELERRKQQEKYSREILTSVQMQGDFNVVPVLIEKLVGQLTDMKNIFKKPHTVAVLIVKAWQTLERVEQYMMKLEGKVDRDFITKNIVNIRRTELYCKTHLLEHSRTYEELRSIIYEIERLLQEYESVDWSLRS